MDYFFFSEVVFKSIGLPLDFMQQWKESWGLSCASCVPGKHKWDFGLSDFFFFVGISCGSPIFFVSQVAQCKPHCRQTWKWLPCTIPFLGHLELCRKKQEISYVGIHIEQRTGSNNSLWFPDLQWFSPHNLLLLHVRHSRQNPVFADETWLKVSWRTLLFVHWGSSF